MGNTLLAFFAANAIYFAGMGCAEVVGSMSPKIRSQSQLERLVKQERKKLAIPDAIIIQATLEFDNPETSYARKVAENSYEIYLQKYPDQHNLNVLRHELYHIADGHCEKESGFLRYLYWNEPLAVIYSVSGIKL